MIVSYFLSTLLGPKKSLKKIMSEKIHIFLEVEIFTLSHVKNIIEYTL